MFDIVVFDMDCYDYCVVFVVVQDYLVKGDVYQVNLIMWVWFCYSGVSEWVFCDLLWWQLVEFVSYFRFEDCVVFLFLFELFLEWMGEILCIKLMKGMVFRG